MIRISSTSDYKLTLEKLSLGKIALGFEDGSNKPVGPHIILTTDSIIRLLGEIAKMVPQTFINFLIGRLNLE